MDGKLAVTCRADRARTAEYRPKIVIRKACRMPLPFGCAVTDTAGVDFQFHV